MKNEQNKKTNAKVEPLQGKHVFVSSFTNTKYFFCVLGIK